MVSSLMRVSVLLAGLASFVTSSPLTPRQAPSTTVTPPARYYLQTEVVPGLDDSGSNKSGLYVYSYHTGAGLGIAALGENTTSMWGFYNETDTTQSFTYEGSAGPWPWVLNYGAYQVFNDISISIADGPGTEGFFFNETGLQNNQSSAGWLACDWWFGVPQLFTLNGYPSGELPSSCSQVNLLPVSL